ncbi:MAG: hypothetical protein HQK51_18950 [Oligoflexia bacterium]|nr:hypothetical protein [Oligoflexia bacterium]
MNFSNRKEVIQKIDLLKRILYSYTNINELDFLKECLGADHFETHKVKLQEAIERLQSLHDGMPYGLLYPGPYYLNNSYAKEIVAKNEALLLKPGFTLWCEVDKKLNLYNYIRNPYKDAKLSSSLRPEDGRPIYSFQELKEYLNRDHTTDNNTQLNSHP